MIASATFHLESYDATRRRMIAETEAALEMALADRSVPRIPTIEVGCGGFDSGFAEQFWRGVLDLSSETPRLLKIFRAVRSAWRRSSQQ